MIKHYYSYSKKGFFSSDVITNIPEDCVEISQEYKQTLLHAQYGGKVIGKGVDGIPVIEDKVFDNNELGGNERRWRNSELVRSDVELFKVQDSDPKSKGTVSEWREYRKQLRAWPEHPSFPNSTFRPVPPDA